MITQEEYEAKAEENKEYGFNDSIGKFGLELAYEDILKGVGGEKIVQKDSDGNVTGETQTVNAKPGKTLYLTIDKDLQTVANKALAKQVKAAKANGKSEGTGHGEDCETGAVVMLSVKDFSVLAAASYPTYDLNKYSKYGKYYVSLAKDKNSPMYNRAFVGSFAPGSVFKPCVAGAALQEGVISKNTQITCSKYYNYYPSNPVACMGTHGAINLNTALTKSCNYYFAETGRKLGINTMYLYAERFGLGEKTGLEISESSGFLAGRDSTTWTDGNTVQAAIGQSDNAFTPVQLATYVATIANNGTRLKTHLVKEIRNYERTKVIEENTAEIVDNAGISKANLKIVQQGMRSVVSDPSGTAYSVFGNYKVAVAAKTGTAENSGSDHTVFICYAPYDKPEVAIAVVLEHGAYGRYSMGVAKALLDEYFK
jgi:penicillin-binding protein 2